MSHLLKQKSKVGIIQRERKSYEAYDISKRMKQIDGTTKIIKQGQEKREEEKQPEKPIKKIYAKRTQDIDGDDVMNKS